MISKGDFLCWLRRGWPIQVQEYLRKHNSINSLGFNHM